MFATEPVRPMPGDRCASYARVSTPKQKLEHQLEHIERFCKEAEITIPNHYRFEDKLERHKSDKREQFQELLELVRQDKLDWIIVAAMDRWGVANVDEFFHFRRELAKHDVQLWSVVDNLNLSGCTDADYFQVVAKAIGNTAYVQSQARNNILKMISMAEGGWAATGNNPYGCDLVCYPLTDLSRPMYRCIRLRYKPALYKIVSYASTSRVERNSDGIIVSSQLVVEKEEVTSHLPPRDKKATGYRFEPTVDAEQLRTLKLVFELADAGMGYNEISRNLYKQGKKHYSSPFAWHAVESILKNSVYIGRPAWGKNGVGAYQVVIDKKPVVAKRKKNDTLVIKKSEADYIYPLKPIFAPIIETELFERVQETIKAKVRTNSAFGKRRTKSRTHHPLNGKIICPDCGKPMVLGMSVGKKTHGTPIRSFNCGTYRKSGSQECFANTIRFDKLQQCIDQMLAVVEERLGLLTDNLNLKTLRKEKWLSQTELGRVLTKITQATPGKYKLFATQKSIYGRDGEHVVKDDPLPFFEAAFTEYDREFTQKSAKLQARLDQIDAEINHIGDEVLKVPSETLRKKWYAQLAALEAEKKEIEPQLVPLTAKAEALVDQLRAIRGTIRQAENMKVGRLLDSFVERVVPQFEERKGSKVRKVSRHFTGVVFHPKGSAEGFFPEPCLFGATRTGRGSCWHTG